MTDFEDNKLTQKLNTVKSLSPSKQETFLLEKAKSLPKLSGCYLFKSKDKNIIYIGKAKNLKSRVSSYFNQSTKSLKTQILVSRIHDFEFIITNSEVESLVLENNLIKEYKPRYNIRLRDDKTYPYISIDTSHDFPLLEYTRKPKKKNNMLTFGPYPAGTNVSDFLKSIRKALMLRDCSNFEFQSRKEPCLLYQMSQCSAPCVGKISKQSYSKDFMIAKMLLASKKESFKALTVLKEKMMEQANAERFEQAAMLRDHITKVESFLTSFSKQEVELNEIAHLDVIAYYIGDSELDISFYLIRHGILVGQKNFNFLVSDLFEDIEIEVGKFILQYYFDSDDPKPNEVVIDLDEDKLLDLNKAIELNFKAKICNFIKPRRKYKKIAEMAFMHAKESQRVRLLNQDSPFVGLNRLKDLLGLSERPRLLECYDIAIWQGKSPCASQVVFRDGSPDKKLYRFYNLKELPEGNNDFKMMQEVVERRLKHKNFPDIFVIDGGKAQVSMVLKVLEEHNLKIPVVGIAKAKNIARSFQSSSIEKSDERLIIPNRANPFILHKCPSLYRILVQMRDEAHRFSRKLHHKKEKQRIIHSWVDEVKGIGQKSKKEIIRKLSLPRKELELLSISELAKCLNINLRHARLIFDYLHATKKS